MVTYKINNPELSKKNLRKKFEFYGRWSVCQIDMNEPETTIVKTEPQPFCSNSFIKINFADDGVSFYYAHPSNGRFIAKIFDFEKNRPSFPPILQFKQDSLRISNYKVIWSNRTSKEIIYNWRTGVKHK